jgi:hypothetical protein
MGEAFFFSGRYRVFRAAAKFVSLHKPRRNGSCQHFGRGIVSNQVLFLLDDSWPSTGYTLTEHHDQVYIRNYTHHIFYQVGGPFPVPLAAGFFCEEEHP